MTRRITRQKKIVTRYSGRITKKRRKSTECLITRSQLIRQNKELQEALRVYMEQFEELRSLYLTATNRYELMRENNRELASKYENATLEIELLKSKLERTSKQQLVKVSAIRREHNLFVENLKTLKDRFDLVGAEFNTINSQYNSLLDQAENRDPTSLFHPENDNTLSLTDISNLEGVMQLRRTRSIGRSDDLDRRTRMKEKVNFMYCDRINLTAMSEESEPTSSSPPNVNNSTFSIHSKKDESRCEDADNQLCSTLLDQSLHVSLLETPSFRRIVPKTPQLDSCEDDLISPADRDDWLYNSEVVKYTPNEVRLSTSLDSIQNFIPKTPKLTQPMARVSTGDSSAINGTYINRFSVAYPEQSPITSSCTRASRRLLESTVSSKTSLQSNTNNDLDESKIESIVGSRNESKNETRDESSIDSKTGETNIRRSNRIRKKVVRVNITKL